MLRKLKLPIIILVIVLLNQAAGYAVQAAVPNSWLSAGSTRFSVAQASTMITTNSTGWENIGLQTAITIPTGKTGDVMIFFCGSTVAGTYAQARALVGGSMALPGETKLRGNAGGAESQCINFFKTAFPAGTTTVRIQWKSPDGQVQSMWNRSLIVIVNIH